MPKNKRNELTQEYLKGVIRSTGKSLLKKPNITSIGIGYKIKNGKLTNQLCIQVTVERKLSPENLRIENIDPLDKTITADDGTVIPIDVVQRSYKTSFEVVSDPEARAKAEELSPREKRRKRLDTVMPGVSVSHRDGTAGTLGAVVYDNDTGQAYILSNWHVLHRSTGKIGDPIVQPGPYDGGNIDENIMGRLVRSHLGLAGDCAIGSIDTRSYDEEIFELGVNPQRVAKVNLGDQVVKSGRTTGVTYGRVQRVEVVVNVNYGDSVGVQEIGGFEIGPDPQYPPPNGEVSMGGDSGSLWLIQQNGEVTDIAVGLHFAGETDPDPQAEHALACNIHSVLEKLHVSFVESDESTIGEEELMNHLFSLVRSQGSRLRDLESRIAKCRCTQGPQDSPSSATQATDPGTSSTREATMEGLPVYGNCWCGPGQGGRPFVPQGTGGTATLINTTRGSVKSVVRSGKKVWKALKNWL